MDVRRVVLLACSLALLGAAMGCGDFFVGDETLDHITVTPASKLLAVEETQQYKASAVNVGGDSSDVTSSATWTSSDTSVATVDSSGLVTALSAGADDAAIIEISAASGGESGSVPLVVTASPLSTLTVGPANQVISRGGTLQLTAIGTLEDSSEVDLADAVTWTSQDTTVATVDSSGFVTALSTGTASTVKITATISTKTESKTDDIDLVIQ
jgi:trimeric autotransporter adhesin